MYKRIRTTFAIGAITSVIALTSCALYIRAQGTTKSPLKAYSSRVPYQLYTPRPLPAGYSYSGEVSLTNETVFYTLHSDHGDITISEQAMPAISSMRVDGFNTIATDIGSMMIGSAMGTPTAFISTEKTLISLRSIGASQDDLTAVGKSLQKL